MPVVPLATMRTTLAVMPGAERMLAPLPLAVSTCTVDPTAVVLVLDVQADAGC